MDLSLERWDSATSADREEMARRLARQLPTGFTFQAIREHRLGERRHQVAIYEQGQARFSLIPGGMVSLGHDPARPWEPNPDELESWQGTAEEYGFDQALPERVASVMLPARRVELAPFLIETAAGELCWESIEPDDPEVKEILREHGFRGQVKVVRGGTKTRVGRDDDGTVVASRSLSRTHADLAGQLEASGFRFPTSDEWEYACGGGDATTLFRWGDHAPCDRYPTDISPEEAAWRREWVFSRGKLEYPPEGFEPDWDLHRRPNAFGLFIASDPSKYELVAEIGTRRGGDGGVTICGGAGFFVGWLTLATAYFEDYACKHDPTEPVSAGFTVGRRVLELR